MRATRLVSLLLLLQTRGQLTAAEVAGTLEVSVRTVHRDVESLAAAGVPVEAVRGPAGGYRLAGGYRTRLTGLTADEAEALFAAGIPGPAAELGLGGELAAARLKVLAALPQELQERASRSSRLFHLDTRGWFRAEDRVPQLPALSAAVWRGCRVRLRYREGGRLVQRTVDPLGLVLKGGAEAQQTNRVLVSIWHEALTAVSPSLRHAICSLADRADVARILEMDRDIDLVVPRGSTEFVNYVFQHSRIPVLGHGSGICHIYADSAADLSMAREVIVDAKTQYPAACNSVEKVLIHKDVAEEFVPELVSALQSAGVEVRGCSQTAKLLPRSQIIPATEEDWHTEYGDLKITIKVVSDIGQAIEHINHYGSRHTESILTQDTRAAELFMDEVDAASVFHNASTRFADGFRYGLGAELGISNSKLHARGPVGLEGLLTYKYKLHGSGQTVTDYAQGRRTFKHRRE